MALRTVWQAESQPFPSFVGVASQETPIHQPLLINHQHRTGGTIQNILDAAVGEVGVIGVAKQLPTRAAVIRTGESSPFTRHNNARVKGIQRQDWWKEPLRGLKTPWDALRQVVPALSAILADKYPIAVGGIEPPFWAHRHGPQQRLPGIHLIERRQPYRAERNVTQPELVQRID